MARKAQAVPDDIYSFDPAQYASSARARGPARRVSVLGVEPTTSEESPSPDIWQGHQRLGTVQKSLRPEMLQRLADMVRHDTPLFRITASLVAPHVAKVYQHTVTAASDKPTVNDSWHRDLSDDQLSAASERLESVTATVVEALNKEEGFDPWRGLAEWMFSHLTAWAVESMEINLGVETVRSMTVDEFNQHLDDYLFDTESKAFQDRYDHLLGAYAQHLARLVVDVLDLPKASPERLERLLGLRPLEQADSAPSAGSRAPHDLLSPLLADGHLTVMSSGHYHALREALYKNTFQQIEGTPWPTAVLEKGNARGQAQLRPALADGQLLLAPEEAEALANVMWHHREELSDLDADVLDALSALWLRQARSLQDDAVADVDRLLEMRGIKPKRGGQGRRGGYEPEQRAEMLRALTHIQNLWLNMHEMDVYETDAKGRRKRVKQAIQSRPFVITDRVGQQRLDGYMDVRTFVFRPGKAFAHFLMGPGQQTALLSAKALKYDPYHQRWEKRLARYFSWQWRTRARNADFLRPFRIETLMDAADESVDSRNPSRTRDRLEKALDALQRDQVIAMWQYDRWNEEAANRRGWAQEWLQATVLIEPPEVIKDHYQRLERKDVPPRRALPPESLGDRVKLKRKALGLSQLQAAERLEISQGYLSLLERGKISAAKLSQAVVTRITQWLSDDPAH